MRLEFVVHGQAQPAGSKNVVPIGRRPAPGQPDTRRRVPVEANRKARPWQQSVAEVAARVMDGRPLLDGALRLRVVFFRARPRSHYKASGEVKASAPKYPTSKPDTTKLMRGTEDALKGIVWSDDSRVCDQHGYKRYGTSDRAEVIIEDME